MTDSVKDIRGVDTSPKQGKRMALGRSEVAGARTEVIRPGKYSNGWGHDGTPAGAENSSARKQRYKDGEAHRKAERGAR